MLRTLRIRNLVIIEDLSVEFGPGLNVMTGETGAGKSILVDALGLVAGARADKGLLRSDADRAIVEALFEVGCDSPARAWLERSELADLVSDEGELLVRRELVRSGSGRITLNGSPCTRTMLARLAPRLIQLHGQHEFRSLLSPEEHRRLLDRTLGDPGAVRGVGQAHAALLGAREARSELRQRAAAREQRLDALARLLRDIDEVGARPGELAELAAERKILRNSATVSELLDQILGLVHEGESNSATWCARAARKAEQLAEFDPALAELADRLTRAALEIDDAGAAFADYRRRLDFDPNRLEAIESRRLAIDRLLQRHGLGEEEMLERRADAEEEMTRLRDVEGRLVDADADVRRREADYVKAATRLGKLRRKGAKQLALRIADQLSALALPEATFEIRWSEPTGERVSGDSGPALPLHPRGAERPEFMLAANPGEPPGPLQRVASGGELSRVMLALHAAVDGDAEGRALVFDEVDAGIGGAVADAVGERLARLAHTSQVLCVTHLPQVAAYGDRHFFIRKRIEAGRTRAEAERVEGERRIGELARMLGGRRATATSRRHASELLHAAGRATRSAG